MEEGWDFDAAPAEFKQVQPFLLGLFAVSGTGWLINYITTIRTAFRDRTPGVSLIALSNNLAWELVFAILHPPPLPVATIIVRSWLLVDIFVIYTTVRFARGGAPGNAGAGNAHADAHTHPPAALLSRSLPLFVLAGILGFASGHWALSVHLGPLRAFYWSGMLCLFTMSGTALHLLVQRGHTRGASYGMW
jgi:paspaline synthase